MPGTEYALAKEEPLVNGKVSKQDAHAAAAALLSEDAEGTHSSVTPTRMGLHGSSLHDRSAQAVQDGTDLLVHSEH